MSEAKAALVGLLGILAVAVTLLVGCPSYYVYLQGMNGRASLAEAEYSRQIKVQEAKAHLDSASMLADAEVKRAEGVARANVIVGESLKGNDAYLRWLWIQAMDHAESPTVIYVPTEGGLPILHDPKRGQ